MYSGAMVFSQLINVLPWKSFHTIVKRLVGDFVDLGCYERYLISGFMLILH